MQFVRSVLVVLCLVFLSFCGGKSSGLANGPLISLPSALLTLFDNLSGKVSVFNENGDRINGANVKFLKDESGAEKFSIPVIILPKGSFARYVITFLKDDLELCYLQFTQTISTTELTSVTINPESAVCSVPSDFSASQFDLLNAEIAKGILPDVDADDDGFSNLQEVLAGSGPRNGASKPVGPQIKNFSASLSEGTKTLSISAEIEDGNGIDGVNLIFTNSEPLKLRLSEKITGEKGGQKWVYEGNLNYLNAAPGKNLEIALIATNALKLTSTQTILQPIPEAKEGDENLSPIVVFENFSEGDVVSGTIDIKIAAYDRDGVSSIQLIGPEAFKTSPFLSPRAVISLNTQALQNGPVTLVVEAIDGKGLKVAHSLNLNINNGSGNERPLVVLEVFYEQGALSADDEGITSVYGIIEISAEVRDPRGNQPKSFVFRDETLKAKNSIVPSPRNFSATDSYRTTIDTTLWNDGDLITISAEAKNSGNIGTKESRTLRVENKPVFKTVGSNRPSREEDGLLKAYASQANPEFTLSWEVRNTAYVNVRSLTNTDENQTNLPATASYTMDLKRQVGEYQIEAVHFTNKGEFKNSARVLVQWDDDEDLKGDKKEDNCVGTSNPDQEDTDGDGFGDACDNCPNLFSKYNSDDDGDGQGDNCDNDADGDGILNAQDNCPLVFNQDQADENHDSIGDRCNGSLFSEVRNIDLGNNNIIMASIGDINGDGYTDIIAAGHDLNVEAGSSSRIFSFYNNQNLNFNSSVNHVEGDLFKVFLSDLDENETLDILSLDLTQYSANTNNPDIVKIYYNKSENLVGNLITYPGGRKPFSAIIEDLDADGIKDFVVSNDIGHDINIYFGEKNEDGIFFNPPITMPTNNYAWTLVVADMDEDGDKDIISSDLNVMNLGELNFFYNQGNRLFLNSFNRRESSSSMRTIQSADMDQDGHEDIIGVKGNFLKFLFNNGNNVFTPLEINFIPMLDDSYDELRIGDLDQDGDQDIVMNTWEGKVHIIMNIGNRNFLRVDNGNISGFASSSISLVDIDGDNDLDIITTSYEGIPANQNGGITIFYNNLH